MPSFIEEAPSAATAESEQALRDFVRAERVRFVFIQAPLPMFFSPLAAAILSGALWGWIDHRLLIGWTGALMVIAILRVLLVYTYPRVSPTVEQVRRWERIFVASVLLVDVCWGFGALALLRPDLLAERALVFSFLMLMAGGHAASYVAHPVTVLLGVLALALPITVAFALRADAPHLAMAVAAVLYLLATFRSIKTLGFFFDHNHRLAHELRREKERVERLARIDALTDLNNRRAFYELGQASLRHATRYHHPLVMLMLDIDHFKTINDQFGHAAGDAAIRAVAALIRSAYRTTDVSGRLGGEEFAILLPETSPDAALTIAERLRSNVEAQLIEHESHTIRLTTSVGVALMREGDSLDALIARADAALYDAKHAGRNRVVAARDSRPPA
jgi:diguanylate cyclase (GGDEF)-like protein